MIFDKEASLLCYTSYSAIGCILEIVLAYISEDAVIILTIESYIKGRRYCEIMNT